MYVCVYYICVYKLYAFAFMLYVCVCKGGWVRVYVRGAVKQQLKGTLIK